MSDSEQEYAESYYSDNEEYQVARIQDATYIEQNQQDSFKRMFAEIEGVTRLFKDVNSTEARRLLQNCEWKACSVKRVLYVGGKCKEKLYNLAGVQMKDTSENVDKPQSSSEDMECEVCLEKVSVNDRIKLECDHIICRECLKDSFVSNIDDRLEISCPGVGCNNLFSFEFILKILTKEKYRSSYCRNLVQSYIDSKPDTIWCPGIDCDLAFKLNKPKHLMKPSEHKRQCSKGHSSCLNCQQPWHAPLDCAMLKKWLKKCRDDSETANWIVANTKECPHCHTSVEKNGGCNRMTCMACKGEWCWICEEKWAGHKTCIPKKEGQNVLASRAALEGYMLYFYRYAFSLF